MTRFAERPETERIRELNDRFRRTLTGGTVSITPAVQSLPPDQLRALLEKIQTFTDFESSDDPYGEHDFGAVEIGDPSGVASFFWKIDYYGLSLDQASPDPTDPAVTKRVMTIMRSDEY